MQDSTKRLEEALADCLATQASLQRIVAKHSERFEKQWERYEKQSELWKKNIEEMDIKWKEQREEMDNKIEEKFQILVELINNLPDTIKTRIGFT
jgi:translation initiation factor 2 alpha subunit (eIF-2alpha)